MLYDFPEKHIEIETNVEFTEQKENWYGVRLRTFVVADMELLRQSVHGTSRVPRRIKECALISVRVYAPNEGRHHSKEREPLQMVYPRH